MRLICYLVTTINNNIFPFKDQEDVQRRLLQLSLTTGYEILQKQGQRVYGPPPGMAHSRPEIGAQVYVSKIPRDCYEAMKILK